MPERGDYRVVIEPSGNRWRWAIHKYQSNICGDLQWCGPDFWDDSGQGKCFTETRAIRRGVKRLYAIRAAARIERALANFADVERKFID